MKKTLLIACAVLPAMILTGCKPYSTGARHGVVSKLSYKGVVCKSWEGELVMGGLRNNTDSDGVTSIGANIFEFSVTSEAVVSDLINAQASGAPISLTYNQFILPDLCGRKTDYVITAVGDRTAGR